MKTCVVVAKCQYIELNLSLYYIVITVSFSQAAYNATDGEADIVLVLSQSLDIQSLTVNVSFVSDAGANEDLPKGRMVLIVNVSYANQFCIGMVAGT